MSFDFLKERDDGVVIVLKVRPRAKKDGPMKFGPDQTALGWGITAPPVDGKANEALMRSLSRHLSVKQSSLALIKGETSRVKAVLIGGRTKAQVLRLIDASPSFER